MGGLVPWWGASIQDGGSSSLTDCSAALSSVHCCHPLLLLTFSIMSFTHGWLFFSSPSSFYTHLITLLCPSSVPPFLTAPASFLFLAWLFLQLCSISSLSGCGLVALCVRSGRGQAARGSYYSRAHVADGVNGGLEGGGSQGERRRGRGAKRRLSDVSKTQLSIGRARPAGEPRGAKRPEMGGLVFLDVYILSACRPPENSSEGDECLAEVSALLLRRVFGFWGNVMSRSCMK